jgi:succinate dehydrogenase / fumarate reductase flavoprotein subunit
MRIYPAPHYTMGGLWVDYNLESTIPGLFVLGEANFSDHGANRLGASALMQGLADGYFIVSATIATHFAGRKLAPGDADDPAFRDAESAAKGAHEKLLSIRGNASPDSIHRELGLVMWNRCGMARNAAGLKEAIAKVRALRAEFWENVRVPGDGEELNASLEHAGRVATSSSSRSSSPRTLSSGRNPAADTSARSTRPPRTRRSGTTRTSRTPPSSSSAATAPREALHKEPLAFEVVHPSTRSYR